MDNKNFLPYWAIIPAAGAGKRMLSNIPKQYLPLAGKTVIEQTLSIFINHPLIDGIVVAISEADAYWPEVLLTITKVSNKPILVAQGGNERKDSVLSALHHLQQKIKQNSWVLVHDAARPCLLSTDIDKLISTIRSDDIGGLLALPVSDTLKRSIGQTPLKVEKTVNRDNIYRALTPQQFKLIDLINALESNEDKDITDESSAMELLGLRPLLIEGKSDNIKITHPNDLIQAEQFMLNHQSHIGK